MMIDEGTYKRIYSELRSYRDIERLSRIYTDRTREFFLVIYTQKMIRQVTQNYHRVRSKTKKLQERWRSGRTLLEISEDISFPPVMTAFLILTNDGYGKKTFRRMLNDPSRIDDRRLRRELIEVAENDPIYSPEGNRVQRERGVWGEEMIRRWLEKKNITYRSEEDLRAEGKKTPDFLFERPLFYRGEEVNWIESKASFGDLKEINKNLDKQLLAYRKLFGPGMVIYWFGFVDTAPLIEGIIIETEGVLKGPWDI